MRNTLLLLIAITTAAAAPTPKPAPKPATAPARIRDALINGSVRFLVPAEWELSERGTKGDSVIYLFPDEKGRAVMLISQQNEGIPPNNAQFKAQLAKFVLEKDTQDLKDRKLEIIDPPKVEPDARFILKVHERFKDGEATVDAVHFYRGVGLNLISVTASANTEEKEEAKRAHDAGALMLLSVNLGAQDPKLMRPLKKKE